MTPTERAQLLSAKVFATGLRDPFSPSICAVCFMLFTKKLEPGHAITKFLQTKCHAFWDSLMAFVAADWTPELEAGASASLERANAQCVKCRHTGRGVHVHHPEANSWFGFLFMTCCSSLHAVNFRQIINSTVGRGGKSGRWPICAEQLFPYGPEATIAALIDRLGAYHFAEAVIGNLVSLQRFIVLPILLKPVHRSRIMASIIRRLTMCMAAIDTDLAKLRPPVGDAARDAVVQQNMQKWDGTALLLYFIAFGPDYRREDRAAFFGSDSLALFRVLDPLVLLLEDCDKNAWMRALATNVWASLSISEREEHECIWPPAYAERMVASPDIMKDPYCALHYFLSHCRATQRICNGPGCAKTVSAAFFRCGKCQGLQYCSKACQKADWTRAPFPHREICDMLHELYTFASPDVSFSPEEFSDACRAHAFPLERVDSLIAWATEGKSCSGYASGKGLVVMPEEAFEPGAWVTMPEEREVTQSEAGLRYVMEARPGPDGRMPSQSEVIAALLKVKEKQRLEGWNLSWGMLPSNA